MPSSDDAFAAAKDRGHRHTLAIDDAYARGELDEAGWHRAWAEIVVPAYTQASTPQGGSGHTGSAADWEWSRGVVGECLARSGTFLDVGCANGLLMESVERWGALRGLAIEAHGLDIAPELAELTVKRVPAFAGRVHVGNALGWTPPQRYDCVRTGLEYVPPPRRRALVARLLDEVIAEGGRLIVGKYNEELEPRSVELAEERGEPVGWIQGYRWADYPEHAARLGAGPTEAGVDLGIGDASRLGRGLGPRILRAFVREVVFADPDITACVSDPELRNTRSLRAFEKAGFEILRGVHLEPDRCVVRLRR